MGTPDAHPDAPAAGGRRVGRPSRASERREQILDAVERCIVERGLEGTTLARVADAAGVQRSLIHHYLGNREAMLRAAASRALANVETILRAAIASAREEGAADEVERALDVLFGPEMQDPRITHLIDELGIAALRDARVRALMGQLYDSFVGDLERELARAFPHAPKEQRRTVAHAITGLADAASRFADYEFDPQNFERMRAVAAQLVDGLRDGGGSV